MLGDISIADNIYIVTGYTDMRKSIDGLCAIILKQLQTEPDRNAIYLFCGKRCDRIKVLLREPDGYVLLYKRLDVVHGKYRWPRNSSEVKPITWQQFDWLTVKYVIKNLKKCRFYADFQHYLWYTKGMENKRISIDELNNLSKETISLLYLQTFEMLQNLQAQNASLIAQVEDLKQQMAILINQRFGKHSEKLSQLPGQLSFNMDDTVK